MFDRRKEFEAALRAEGFDSDHYFQGAYADRYDDDFTQCRWEGWNLKCESVSAKPAPVAEPVAHVIEERSTRYISAEDAMQSGLGYSAGSFPVVNLSITMLPGKHMPPVGTKFYLRPPAPALAVADEGRFEEVDVPEKLLYGWIKVANSTPPMWKREENIAKQAIAWDRKQSRSPVQEGAQCSCASGETTGWTEDNLMVPRCNICGLPVMRIIEERKAERSAPSQAIPEGRPIVDEDSEYTLEQAIRLADLWGAGKMIGGDEDAVIQALLKEVKRLRGE